MNKKKINSICPSNKQEWRSWLEKNHLDEDSVWLIIHKKSAATPTITWSDAVDEALCFGWVDSVRRPIDAEQYMQYFGKRKATGTWSKINKDKIAYLIGQGIMSEAGFQSIERAKQNGSWTILDDVEKLIIPDDLEKELKNHPNSMDFFLGLNKSVRKAMLQWIVLAKRPETRQKRIKEIAEKASKNLRPRQF